MKKSLLLTLLLLAGTATFPIRAHISIPTAIASWALATGGFALGALATHFGITTTKFTIAVANHPKEESPADKDFNRRICLIGGLVCVSSAALSYHALKNAHQLLK